MLPRFRRTLALKILVTVGLAIFMLFHARATQQTPPAQSNDHVSRMARYLQNGRFDDALEEGRLALNGDPENPFILNQIAIVYLTRAGKEPAYREKWVHEAIGYIEHSLRTSSKTDPKALLDIVLAARSLEIAGDLSVEKCTYYRRAADALENHSPPLKDDKVVMGGHVVSLAPVIQQKKTVLAHLKKKMADARCDGGETTR